MHTIVDRSKKVGIKSVLKTGQPGLRVQHRPPRAGYSRRMISSGRRQLIVRGQSASSSLGTRPMISSGRGRLIVGSLPGPSSLPLPPDDQLGTSEASSAVQ